MLEDSKKPMSKKPIGSVSPAARTASHPWAILKHRELPPTIKEARRTRSAAMQPHQYTSLNTTSTTIASADETVQKLSSISSATMSAAQAVLKITSSVPTLLGLPAELRNRIDELQLPIVPAENDWRLPDAAKFFHIGWDTFTQPPLARVNKELRSTVLPMWRHIALSEVDYVEAPVFDYEFDSMIDFLQTLMEPDRSVHVVVLLSFPTNLFSTRIDRRDRLRKWLRATKFCTRETLGMEYHLSEEDLGRSDSQDLAKEVEQVAGEKHSWWDGEGEDIWEMMRDTLYEKQGVVLGWE